MKPPIAFAILHHAIAIFIGLAAIIGILIRTL